MIIIIHKKNGSVDVMNQDPQNEASMQRNENLEKFSGIMDQSELALGGAKRPHESSYSKKEQLPMGSLENRNDGRQLEVVGQTTSGWIQVKPKKGKKGHSESSHNP